MRITMAHPTDHTGVARLPFRTPLAEWDLPGMHRVLGLHRHEVRLVEVDGLAYVAKELPDDLAQREYRLLRELDDDGLPTATVVAVITDRPDGSDGMLVTRHLDYSLPYRSLLSGRGLTIPFLGDRLLDALVSLLVRLHLAGFYWGDCSLSNALFRRDAGTLAAYVIDVETGERHHELTHGQRDLDLAIACENVAGGLLDLQAAGRLTADIDPFTVADDLRRRYDGLWNELTVDTPIDMSDQMAMRHRLDRLHDLGFDAAEIDVVSDGGDDVLRVVPRVVEHGFHSDRLAHLTGLVTGENQARRMLDDIRAYGATMTGPDGRRPPENVIAVRWLDRRFEPIIAAIPDDLLDRLQAAEIFHQLLEHRWFLAERAGHDIDLDNALADYLDQVLSRSEPERVQIEQPTAELPRIEPLP